MARRLGPGRAVVAVNGQAWSGLALRTAIAGTHTPAQHLRLSIKNGAETWDADINDSGGARYPQLQRADGSDLMGEILRSRTSKGLAAQTRDILMSQHGAGLTWCRK